MPFRFGSFLLIVIFCGVVFGKFSTETRCWGQIPIVETKKTQAQTKQTQTKDDDIRLFMRAKLTSSQKLLEGLVTEDFAKIQKGASEMRLLSKGSSWPQAKDKIYNHHNTAFQIHCQKIEELAKKKNLEGVKFTYLQLTTSCVDCHSYVRGKFKVKRPINKKGPVQLIPTYWDDK